MKHIKDIKNVNMKKPLRRNQITATTLAVMIVAAGYLNYAGKKELAAGGGVYEAGAMDISDEDILVENQNLLGGQENLMEIPSLDQDLGDIEMVDAETLADNAGMQTDNGDVGVAAGVDGEAATTMETAASSGLENPGEAVLASGMSVTDYIADVQLNREQTRAKNEEILLNTINNTNIEENAKQAAIQNMIELTETTEKENAVETLLMAKGFPDLVVSITSGKVGMVVNAISITDAQRAQIESVVERKAEVEAENIIITLLNLEE